MNIPPMENVAYISHDAWAERARRYENFEDLTNQQQKQLAKTLGIKIPSNLDEIGRIQWAKTIERHLINDWVIPGSQPTKSMMQIVTQPTSTITDVHYISPAAWVARAKQHADFENLTHEQQEQLATMLEVTIPPRLNETGRIEWAKDIERSLINGWAIATKKTPEITFGTLGM